MVSTQFRCDHCNRILRGDFKTKKIFRNGHWIRINLCHPCDRKKTEKREAFQDRVAVIELYELGGVRQ